MSITPLVAYPDPDREERPGVLVSTAPLDSMKTHIVHVVRVDHRTDVYQALSMRAQGPQIQAISPE
jgi:hypothetical protein